MASPEIVIVGAGPYGLSIAAHLTAHGIPHRIFGKPMQSWREHMPTDMMLKSDGFASSLFSPGPASTLRDFCAQQCIPYHDTRIPVSLQTFVHYGLDFQQRFVPHLETEQVTAIDRIGSQFSLRLDNGEQLTATKVILAVGISHFAYFPPEIATLPPELLSHSYSHREPAHFSGRHVTILGGGASAANLAAMLREAGAHVCILARRRTMEFHDAPGPRTLWQRLRSPSSSLGPGIKSFIFSKFPHVFRLLPEEARLQIVQNHLGPAAGWTVRDRVEGKVPFHGGISNLQAQERDGYVRLTYMQDGAHQELYTSHLIAATGYRVSLHRLPFLNQTLRNTVRTTGGSPLLSSRFESSVRGLYFTGLAAANSFGPLMRFACGAEYTASTLSKHLRKLCHATGGERLPHFSPAAQPCRIGQSLPDKG